MHLNDVIATLTKEFEGMEQKKIDLETELSEVKQKNALEIQEINLAPRKTIMSKTRDSMLMNRLSVQISNPNLISDFLKDSAIGGGGGNDLEYIDIIQKLIVNIVLSLFLNEFLFKNLICRKKIFPSRIVDH